MVVGESPAVARRRLRQVLRKAREAKGLTQAQVADALDWSPSKVQRIESGDVAVSSSDLRASLDLFEVSDPKRIAHLMELARTSRRRGRRRGWWDNARYRQHVSPASMQLLQFESEATVIRVYNPSLPPGILQIPAYAEFVLSFWNDELTDEDREVRLEVRQRRRDYVFNRADPPLYYLVLDESMLYRDVGGPRVMHDQLRELLSLMRDEKIMVRIVPFARGAPLAMLNHFIVMDLGDEEDALLYQEAQLLDQIEHSPKAINLYRQRFERLWELALTEEATARKIEARAATILASLDQAGGRADSEIAA